MHATRRETFKTVSPHVPKVNRAEVGGALGSGRSDENRPVSRSAQCGAENQKFALLQPLQCFREQTAVRVKS
jgi:hypothetical protein